MVISYKHTIGSQDLLGNQNNTTLQKGELVNKNGNYWLLILGAISYILSQKSEISYLPITIINVYYALIGCDLGRYMIFSIIWRGYIKFPLNTIYISAINYTF